MSPPPFDDVGRDESVPSGPAILRGADLSSLSALAALLRAGAAELAACADASDASAQDVADLRRLARTVGELGGMVGRYRGRIDRARAFERDPDPLGRGTLRPHVLALRGAAGLRRECAVLLTRPAFAGLDLDTVEPGDGAH